MPRTHSPPEGNDDEQLDTTLTSGKPEIVRPGNLTSGAYDVTAIANPTV